MGVNHIADAAVVAQVSVVALKMMIMGADFTPLNLIESHKICDYKLPVDMTSSWLWLQVISCHLGLHCMAVTAFLCTDCGQRDVHPWKSGIMSTPNSTPIVIAGTGNT